jgi:hypothetical protein
MRHKRDHCLIIAMFGRNVVISAPMTVQKGIIGCKDFDQRMRWTYAIIYPYMYFLRVLKSTICWTFIVIPLFRSLSKNSTKYMRIYYVTYGLKKATLWGRNVSLPSDYTSVVTLKSAWQPHQSVAFFTPIRGDQPWMDVRLASLSACGVGRDDIVAESL